MDPVTEDRAPEPLTEHAHRITRKVRTFDQRHPLLWDLHFTGFWVTAALIDYGGGGWRHNAHNLDVPGWLLFVLSLGLSVPLLRRRTHPGAILAATTPSPSSTRGPARPSRRPCSSWSSSTTSPSAAPCTTCGGRQPW